MKDNFKFYGTEAPYWFTYKITGWQVSVMFLIKREWNALHTAGALSSRFCMRFRANMKAYGMNEQCALQHQIAL
jgi:hypothetical protein